MDAVEIPRVSSIGTETSNTDHHGNLAPTDDYGDFKSTSGNAADSPAATSHNSSSSSEPLSSSPSSPTLRRIRTYSVESCPSPATAVPPNDDSDLESDEDHDCSQSRCPSPDGTFSNGDIRSLDGQLDLDVDDTDANALVFAMGTPVAANLKKEDDSECQGESKYSMTTGHLTPNLSRRGAASLKGLDTIGEGGSLESPLGVLVSSAAENSPVILAHREVQSTCNISDDEASDDEKKNIVRNALFRENAGSSKTARRGEYTDESKEEIDNQIDFPVIELSASHESSGDYYCDYITPSSLRVPVPMTRRESFATVTSEYTFDDDSTTGDNVCPICLCGYKKGDVLVVSQHCTHCFHKDCILEWLEKHDNCPICRINMVTDSEMSRAATSLVGKTRMYRAVASMQSPHSHGAAPNRRNQTNHSSSSNAVSPFAGTMGRAARTRTPGGY